MKNKVFYGLDVVRTILATSVALGHYFYWNNIGTYFPRSFFVAVDFFFVLSGFVITQSIINSKNESFSNFLKEFVIRRATRLFPLYIVVFFITCALLIFSHKLDAFFYFVISFFLLQSMGFDIGSQSIFSDTSIGIAWSLSVEFWIGIMFFPVIFLLKKNTVVLTYILSIIVIIFLSIIFNLSPSIDVNFQRAYPFITFASIRGLIGFSTGAISFLIYKLIFEAFVSKKIITLCEVIVLLIICFTIYIPDSNNRNEFISYFVFSAFIVFISCEKGMLGRLLKSRYLSIFRYPSYSIYLIHPLFVFIWRYFEIPFTHKMSIMYIVLVFLSSLLTYKYIEIPALNLRRCIINKIN